MGKGSGNLRQGGYTVTMQLAFKLLVLLTILAILLSLGQALYYLLRDQGSQTRTVRALSRRIGVSIGLILLLFIGYFTGLIQPQGSAPVPGAPTPPEAADRRE